MQDPAVEIGFTLDRKEQGKGSAREAIQTLMRLLFELSGIQKIAEIIDIHPELPDKILLDFACRSMSDRK